MRLNWNQQQQKTENVGVKFYHSLIGPYRIFQ